MIFSCRSSALLLSIAFLGNIGYVAGCSCFRPETDICAALLDTEVLVRGIIQSKTAFTGPTIGGSAAFSYEVIIKTVFVDANPNNEALKEDQIIEMSVNADGNFCGIEFENDTDMLLDLSSTNGGQYSTSLCSNNIRIDDGTLLRSDFSDCPFLTTLVQTPLTLPPLRVPDFPGFGGSPREPPRQPLATETLLTEPLKRVRTRFDKPRRKDESERVQTK
eukprot:scaffold24271_cov51-Attheya_sp.AAC.1